VNDRVATALRVLGPLEFARDGAVVRLRSVQQRRLLSVLLVHANEVVPSDQLMDVLWGDDPPPNARRALQGLATRLRETLGENRVETRRPGYRLRVASGEVDALRFEELVRVGLGLSDRAEVALGVFDEALGLWRGAPYAEFASEPFASAELARLAELRAGALEKRSAALSELGRSGEVIGDLEAEELPSGTVTFLFTDLEGSTRLWEEHPEVMLAALARHDEILLRAIAGHGGQVVKSTGDGVHAVFVDAVCAVDAAVEAQRGLCRESWGEAGTLRVRMGVHTGAAVFRAGDYPGRMVNKAARVMSVANGGQVLLSFVTAELVRDRLGDGAGTVDLGEVRLRDLSSAERLFQVVHPELPTEFPALRSLDAFPSNLPLQLTAFVGREDELIEVATALREARVVTLTGIGGVGKTRVALQAAARALADYRDGAWFCELAAVGDPDSVVEAVATALGVVAREGQTIDDGLVDFLRVKQLLLVLDNCEHLLDAVANLVDRLVRACARLSVLATSREGLALRGERIFALRPLVLPHPDATTEAAADADAVCLFVERAADARTGFALQDDNAAAIVQICRRLDGIPLAIELAAAWVQSTTPAEIATRLDDQFRLLRGGPRGGIERHQTLRRAMDWSYDLLSADEQFVLERLSVFAGGCSLEDAEAVVAADTTGEIDVLEHVSALVRRSLVLADDHGGHTRYRLLETVRQYAHERLEQSGAAEATQRRHAVQYAALAERAGPGLRGADQVAWIARLTPEIDNLRAAQAWATDHHELDLALTVVVSLCVTGITIGMTALEWASSLATDPDIDTRPLGPTLLSWAVFRAAIGQPDMDHAAALEARRSRAAAAFGLPPSPDGFRAQATIAQHFGTPAEVLDLTRHWVDVARAAGDHYETVQGLNVLASVMASTDDDAAVSVMQECVAEARRLANPSSLSLALVPLGVLLSRTDPRHAVPVLEEAIRVGTTAGNNFAVGLAYSVLGWVSHALGDRRAALRAWRHAIDLHLDWGGGENLVGSFVGIAVTIAEFADDEASAILQGAADALSPAPLAPFGEVRVWMLNGLSQRLGDDRLTELLARGAAMTDDEAVSYAHARLEAVEQAGREISELPTQSASS
jgi:predicted ATPase/class 3 adenylate cyclase